MIVTIDPTPTLRLIMNTVTQQATIIELAERVPYSVQEIPITRLISVLRACRPQRDDA